MATFTNFFKLSIILFTLTRVNVLLDPPSQDTSPYIIPFDYQTILREICDPKTIANYEEWFKNWMTSFFTDNRLEPGINTFGLISVEMNEHLAQMEKHIKEFKESMNKIPFYHKFKLEVSLYNTIQKVGQIIKFQKIPNKFLGSENRKLFNPQQLAYIDEVNSKTNVIEEINEMGKLFKNELEQMMQPGDYTDFMFPVTRQIEQDLIRLLKAILKIYLTNKRSQIYDNITQEEHQTLQTFYDNFIWLYEPTQLREFIIGKLLGKKNLGTYQEEFFVESFFSRLLNKSPYYTPIIYRDLYITKYPPVKLKSIHDAIKPHFFSWDMLNEFDVPYIQMGYNRQKEEKMTDPNDIKVERKKAKLYEMMYMIYIFVRDDQVVNFEDKLSSQQILQKMFDWMLASKDYKLGNESKPIKNYEQLFPGYKYRRYYVPLINLICSKLDKCDLIKDKELQSLVFDKYNEFKNYELLKNNVKIAKLIPQELQSDLQQRQAATSFVQIRSDLDDILQNDELMKTEPIKIVVKKVNSYIDKVLPKIQINDQEPFSKKIDEESRPYDNDENQNFKPTQLFTSPKVNEKQFEEAQKKFNENVGNKFFPTDIKTVLDKDRRVFLDQYLDIVDSTEDPKKKETLQRLIYNYIDQKAKDPESGEVIQKLNQQIILRFINQLMTQSNLEYLPSFRNFLFRIINKQLSEFNPFNPDEFMFQTYDIMLFILCADEFRKQYLPKEEGEDTEKEMQIRYNIQNAQDVLEKFYFKTGVDQNEINKLRQEFLTKESKLIQAKFGVQLMTNFFDFFEFYQIVQSNSPSFINYNLMYENFYHFINQVRGNTFTEYENPYLYVLQNLEMCLAYTDRDKPSENKQVTAEKVCNMSHRKYAEIYYFYKFYLIEKNKQPGDQIKMFGLFDFSTSTRMFLAYAYENSAYGEKLNILCESSPSANICLSQRILKDIIRYTNQIGNLKEVLQKQIINKYKFNNTFDLITLIQSLEAFRLIKHGKMSDHQRVLDIIEAFDQINLADKKLKFDSKDLNILTRYLLRTFRKIDFSSQEKKLLDVIQMIYENSYINSSNEVDFLKSVLTYNDTPFINYIKFFLLYTNQKENYQKIARFIIESNSGLNISLINDVANDKVLDEIRNQAARISKKNKQFKLIQSILQEQYSKLYNLIYEKAKGKIVNDNNLTNTQQNTFLNYLTKYNIESKEKQQKVVNKVEQCAQVQQKAKGIVQKTFLAEGELMRKEEVPIEANKPEPMKARNVKFTIAVKKEKEMQNPLSNPNLPNSLKLITIQKDFSEHSPVYKGKEKSEEIYGQMLSDQVIKEESERLAKNVRITQMKGEEQWFETNEGEQEQEKKIL